MGKVLERYILDRVAELERDVVELKREKNNLEKILETSDMYIERLEKANDFLTGLFTKKPYGISAFVSTTDKEKYEELCELCFFDAEEPSEEVDKCQQETN